MRILHRPVYEGIERALVEIFREGRPADKVIQFHLKQNKKWGSQDRRLFAEGVYDLVRWWRRLLAAAEVDWPKVDRWTGESSEAHARALQVWCQVHEVSLGRGIVPLPVGDARARYLSGAWPRAVRESVPDWLDNMGEAQFGADRWSEMLRVLNTVAPVYLRANTLKTTAAQLVKRLAEERVQCDLVTGDAVKLKVRANVFLTRAFREGHFEVQDLSSQQIAPRLDPKAGERVVDACAGAGGKSLHLAALMQNRGKVLSLDVAERKLAQLRERATRAGATSIEVRVIEGRKVIKRLESSADRLLLDVPCSGLGVLRRNPDSKWKLSVEEMARVSQLQREILRDYVAMLKPGGHLVYATCSVLPSENSDVIHEYMSQNETKFSLLREATLWPEVDGPDGFYFAHLQKT